MPARSLTMGNLGAERARVAVKAAIFRGALGVLGGALSGGCGATAPNSPPPPPRPAEAAIEATFAPGFGERELERVPAIVTLPDPRAWHASTSGTFTLLEHRGTDSRLALRVTLAPRLVRPEQCEAEARLARPSLPGSDANSVVEQRKLAAPAGFDVRLLVGVEPKGTGVHGYALAVGAATSRCYLAAYETESTGTRAAETVAERLAVVVSSVFETLRVPNAERRVQPPLGVE
jgi:hypothetical protein